jgi:hypothetical protein
MASLPTLTEFRPAVGLKSRHVVEVQWSERCLVDSLPCSCKRLPQQ